MKGPELCCLTPPACRHLLVPAHCLSLLDLPSSALHRSLTQVWYGLLLVLRLTSLCRLFILLNLSLSLRPVPLLCRCRQGPIWFGAQQAHACHQRRAG